MGRWEGRCGRAGDTHLGGDDVDQRIIEYLVAEFKKDTGIDAGADKMVLQRLKDAAEKAKTDTKEANETRTSKKRRDISSTSDGEDSLPLAAGAMLPVSGVVVLADTSSSVISHEALSQVPHAPPAYQCVGLVHRICGALGDSKPMSVFSQQSQRQ